MTPAITSLPAEAAPVLLMQQGAGDDFADTERAGLDEPAPARMVPTILLVEDNPINQVVALEFLALMGLQTRLANNGLEALQLCAEAAPDLVLMDIQMPGMDGLECARRLRALQGSGELARFPILALTAHALDSDVQASLAAGMDEHLTKPLDFVSLRLRLARWVEMPQSS
jgi:CheY-like chemotaxis protein